MRCLLSIVALVFCTVGSSLYAQETRSQTPHYLFAWAGDRALQGKDFLAVIDANPSSPNYGHLLTTLVTDQTTLRVHHTEYTMPENGMLFANDHEAGRTFIFDLRIRFIRGLPAHSLTWRATCILTRTCGCPTDMSWSPSRVRTRACILVQSGKPGA